MTAFEPSGAVYTIKTGPKTETQMPLKRYFQRKAGEGYVLEPNKNWNWKRKDQADIEGWDDADTPVALPESCVQRTDDNDEVGPSAK
jgi:hypothetical protein